MQKIFCFLFNILLIFEIFSQDFSKKSLKNLEKSKDSVECIILKNQNLKEIPSEIYSYKNLKKLILSRNKIKHIPDSLSTLRNLHYLDLSSNYIDSLPPSLSELALDTLIMWDNPIYTLPKEFEKWDLKYLDLRAIQMNKEEQKYIKSLFPRARVRMDHPCNCGR
jgi:Leucine-rich repeat (LRR) protein